MRFSNKNSINGLTELINSVQERKHYPIITEIKDKLDDIDIEGLPDFIAYNYGPFSRDLLADIDFLEEVHLLKKDLSLS